MKNAFSKTSFTVNRKDGAKVLNIILSNSLTYLNIEFLDEQELRITILSSNISRYREVFEKYNFDLNFFYKKDLFFQLKGKKHRIGILLGFLILLISVFTSSKFVWTINVTGNEILTEKEVIEELKDSGFYVGSYIPIINYKDIHNKILLSSDKISWISINITGNVANVVIKEKLKEIDENKKLYSNVISKYDGQIISINIEEGEKQVSIGDVVKKGDLLISGILDSKSQGVRYVNAKGEIKAYISKIIEIKIPFNESKKVYTDTVYVDKYYKIFDKSIKFSTKYRNYDTFCDTIEKTEQVTIFDKIKLPIYRTVIKYYEYEYRDVIYSKEQAVDIAFLTLRKKLDKELENAELVSKKTFSDFDEDFFYVTCELYCIEEIGKSVEYEVK